MSSTHKYGEMTLTDEELAEVHKKIEEFSEFGYTGDKLVSLITAEFKGKFPLGSAKESVTHNKKTGVATYREKAYSSKHFKLVVDEYIAEKAEKEPKPVEPASWMKEAYSIIDELSTQHKEAESLLSYSILEMQLRKVKYNPEQFVYLAEYAKKKLSKDSKGSELGRKA